jgi:hypothetical protein
MVSSLLSLLSLLVDRAFHTRADLPPCPVPLTGRRYFSRSSLAIRFWKSLFNYHLRAGELDRPPPSLFSVTMLARVLCIVAFFAFS